jgi:hypothetical protein
LVERQCSAALPVVAGPLSRGAGIIVRDGKIADIAVTMMN